MIKQEKRQTNVGRAAGKIALFFFLTALLSVPSLLSTHSPAADISQSSPPSKPSPPAGSNVEKNVGKKTEKEIIGNIRAALNRIKPFKVEFVQQVLSDDTDIADILKKTDGKKDPGLDVDIEEKGEIIFKHDRLLKWTYLEPDFKVFLLEGDSYRFYDEDNEQVLTGKVKDRNQQWIWQLLFSKDLFRSRQLRWEPANRALHIKSAEMELAVVIDNTSLPVKVLQQDPTSGARIVYHFKSYLPNFAVTEKTFQLDIPEGVDVIREEDR